MKENSTGTVPQPVIPSHHATLQLSGNKSQQVPAGADRQARYHRLFAGQGGQGGTFGPGQPGAPGRK